ncbi:5'/3'-nucleotidase SurE [Verrucomicrobiales bacterium BCK34]|nr:5'/3'-nucleotidase SurE [Verrucomicrobiales bacterium BCK34]
MIALLTNDDGIHADGLEALRELAESYFDEVWVVAPAKEMSQIGHRVTTYEPLEIEERGRRRFAVHGTPADCTRVALTHLLPKQPDWILSGINHGGNLGRHDFAISGTVAAVREAAFAGVRGIAFSHYIRRELPLDWGLAGERLDAVMRELLSRDLDVGSFWNVNLPHLEAGSEAPRLIDCEQERLSLEVCYAKDETGKLHYKGDYQGRPRVAGSDVDVCFSGNIALTLAGI